VAKGSYVGRSPPRAEDRGLVTGTHRYVSDIASSEPLDACFVRSFAAHGILRAVDVSTAAEVPGVVDAYSAGELPDLPDTPTGPASSPPEMTRPSLASERVRFAGEPVAVVLGSDRYAAEDGAELVLVDIDPLDAVVDPVDSADGDIRLFDGVDNVASTREYGSPVDELFASAPVVVEATIRNQRLAPTSIEARAILVEPGADGRLTVWVSHQAPQRLRGQLARALGLDASEVRVIVPKVGGAFGAKSQTFPEYIVVAYLARKLGRPVRWIEDRREALQGATHGRGQVQRVRLAADEAGTMLALEADIDADVGAYPQTGELVPSMTGWVMSGPYRIPRLHVRIRSVVTNLTPTSPYRGAGRPEAAFAVERVVDKLARRLGVDPAELRLRNFISSHEFPYKSPTGALYDSADHEAALRKALDLAGYEGLRTEQRRRVTGEGPLLGVGIGSYVERSGGQPGTDEFGSVEIASNGTIVARSGATPQGQGHETAFAQVVASVLDVDLNRVRIVQGDTDEVPKGTGTFASRSMQVGGSSLHRASVEVLEEARRRAVRHFEVAEEDLVYEDASFTVAGTDRSVGLAELAAAEPLRSDVELAPPQAFPFGSYVAAVEIDTETGETTIVRLVAVDDFGVVVNPKLVEGQVTGSIVQGLGQALYEQVIYDEYGQPLTSSLMDYSLPTISEVPDLVLAETVTPNPNVPLGTKGAGEAGCIGTPPAVVNAIVDALDGRDEGLDMPVTPEKVWRILHRPEQR
jgi:carbon-monoxide dehydrogenase large subunit